MLRLGLRIAKGLAEAEIARLVAARRVGGAFRDLADLKRRAGLSDATLDRLARADAFGSLALGRRPALWQALGLGAEHVELDPPPLFAGLEPGAAPPAPALPAMALGEAVADDYASLRLSLKAHPLALLRAQLPRSPAIAPASALERLADGRRTAVAGLVLVRQQPGSANGVIFITLEDETGIANLIVWPSVFARFRRVVLGARLIVAEGRLQKQGLVIHVVAGRLVDRSDLLGRLADQDGTPLEPPLARADEVRRPTRDRRPTEIVKPFPSRDFH